MDSWKTNHTELIRGGRGVGQDPMGFLAIIKTSQIHIKGKFPQMSIT